MAGIWGDIRIQGCLAALTSNNEDKMPKLKTHSGAKKRFRVTANGKVKSGATRRRHGLRKRSQKMKRESRAGLILFKTDGDNIIKHFLRNA
jgi:large subunit ribosomal protein L35